MPDPIPQTELDEIGQVIDHEGLSGSIDRGHIRARTLQLTGERSEDLMTLQNEYYSTNMSIHDLNEHLIESGYSDEQANTLTNAFHAERSYRTTHDGVPSDLTPNQITYIFNNVGSAGIGAVNLVRNNDGQVIGFTSPLAGRDLDETRTTIPLPPAVPIEVLRQSDLDEQATLNQIADILSNHLSANTATGLTRRETLNNFDIRQIDGFVNQYLRGDINLVEMSDKVSTIYDVENIVNADQILSQIIIDAHQEKEYRDNNNGRPSLLTQQQYDYMRSNSLPSYYDLARGGGSTSARYEGQQIYVVAGTDTFYFISPLGRVQVPKINPDGTLGDPDINPDTIRQQVQYLNIYDTTRIRDSERGIQTGDGLRPNAGQRLTNEQRDKLNENITFLLNQDITFPAFLELTDALTPLNQNQYRNLMNYLSANPHLEATREELEGANFYSDEPLFVDDLAGDGRLQIVNEAQYTTYLESQGLNQEQIDARLNPVKLRWDRAHQVELYNRFGGELPEQSRGQGAVGNLLGHLAYGSITPDEVLDAYSNPPLPRPDPVTGNPITPQEPDTEPLEPPRPTITPSFTGGEPLYPVVEPSARGLGQPRFTPSLEEIEPAEQIEIREYQTFYNQSQSLYIGFRETFRDFLGGLSGAIIGGGVVASYYRSRDRGFVGEIIREERIFLNQLENNINNLRNQLQQQNRRRRINENILDELRPELQEQQRQLQARTPPQLPPAGGSGQSDPITSPIDPTFDPQAYLRAGRQRLAEAQDIQDVVSQQEQNIQQLTNEINAVETELEEAIEITDNLQNDLDNVEMDRLSINNQLERLLNLDYSLINSIQQNFPQVLTGMSVGQALGMTLAGYMFPTYVEIDPVDIGDTEKQEFKKTRIKGRNETNKSRQSQRIPIPEKDLEKVVLPETGTLDPFRKPKDKGYGGVTIGMKANRVKGRALNGKELRELKSILTPEELKRFEGVNVYYNDKGGIETKRANRCLGLSKKNITGIDYNKTFY
jgi:hypothetical protein